MKSLLLSVLLGTLSTLATGCITIVRPSPMQQERALEPGARNQIVFKMNGIADGNYYKDSDPPSITTSLSDNSQLPIGKEKIILTNDSTTYILDLTFVHEISTSAMRRHVGDLLLTDQQVRKKFANTYQETLQLYELECLPAPLCKATVQVDRAKDQNLPTRASIDAWLFSLDEQEITPFIVLRTDDPNDTTRWQEPNPNKGFLRMTNKTRPALVVPLDSTGIARFRYLNPRDPVFLFETLEETATEPKTKTPELSNTRRLLKLLNTLDNKDGTAINESELNDLDAFKVGIQDIGTKAPDATELQGMRTKNTDDASSARAEEDKAAAVIANAAKSGLQKEHRAVTEKLAREALNAIESLNTNDTIRKRDAAETIRRIEEAFTDNLNKIHTLLSQSSDLREQAIQSIIVSQALTAVKAPADEFKRREQTELDKRLASKKIRFDNQTADRYFVITFSIKQDPCVPTSKAEEGEEEVIKFTQDNGGNCTGTISISPRSYVDIDATVVAKAPRKILQFNVDFFDQTDDPSNSTGYISLTKINPGDLQFQPPDRLVTGIVASLSQKAEPFLSSIDSTADGQPTSDLFAGNQQNHLSGGGRLDVSAFLGNRASAKINLAFKSGDFGATADDKANRLSVPQYQINVFGTNALILNYGRMTFAAPSNKIAVNEAGEGFRFSWKNLQLSYILKRESGEGTANNEDEDQDSLIFQISPVPLNLGMLRSLTFTAVRGQERFEREGKDEDEMTGKPAIPEVIPYVYQTYGTEIFFTEPLRLRAEGESGIPFAGSIAVYHSERDSRAKRLVTPEGERKVSDGRGTVGLFSLSLPFNWLEEGEAKRRPRNVASLYLGYGTGDDPKTRTTDESYIGETGKFSRDSIFLSTFPGKANKFIREGLSNKQYLGLQFTDNTLSLTGWLATNFLGVHPSDVISQSTTLRLHDYRFNRQVLGDKDAGREANLEFVLEAPKSVKWTLGGAYFMPGNALKGFVKDEAWTFTAGVSIDPFN